MYTPGVFSIFPELDEHCQSVSEHFHQNDSSVLLAVIPVPATPREPSVYVPWTGLFWIFPIRGIIRHVCFCDWLLPAGTFVRSGPVVACVVFFSAAE